MIGVRYAIYFAPEDDTALARFGWPWLGRHPNGAHDVPFLAGVGPSDVHAMRVAEPRTYGLHATLKAPFRLAEGMRRADVLNGVAAFAAARASIVTAPLTLGEIDGFLVLKPSAPAPAIDALASACVEAFDQFRAPLTDADRARRNPHKLSDNQRRLLERWGYPFVFEEFRFHVTLTGRLDPPERALAREALDRLASAAINEPLTIRSLCLFEQAAPGTRFVLAARFPLQPA